jgi:hypothetical protein
MRIERGFLLVATLGILVTSVAWSATRLRMYPNLAIFRGGGLREPVALQHCCVTAVTVNGRSGASLSGDTLAIIYEDLRPAGQVHVDDTDSTSYTEVAEFFGTTPLRSTGYDNFSTLHRPDLKTLFPQATHFSRIYRGTASQSAIWENPVVAPGGANDQYYAIGASAEKILASLGVRVR